MTVSAYQLHRECCAKNWVFFIAAQTGVTPPSLSIFYAKFTHYLCKLVYNISSLLPFIIGNQVC